jgi:hypothetical protein
MVKRHFERHNLSIELVVDDCEFKVWTMFVGRLLPEQRSADSRAFLANAQFQSWSAWDSSTTCHSIRLPMTFLLAIIWRIYQFELFDVASQHLKS